MTLGGTDQPGLARRPAGLKTSSAKSTEQLTRDAIATIDKNLASASDVKPKRARSGAKAAKKKAADKSGPPKRTEGNGKLSGLDAAAQILGKAKEPMGCKDLVEHAIATKLWLSGGKTPAATLYAALHREIKHKGKDARFQRVARGRFQLRKGA